MTVKQLVKKGVIIPNPETVEIGDDVDIDRISGQGVIIYPGCRIYGRSTLILQGAKIGSEAPATVKDCQIGPKVNLKGGFFQRAVFLKKSSAGSGSHIREGTILEEEASTAHIAGLKQTILFPFVTLGSLINFCDCLMSGGTGRKDHSEVGSSYIHFNYTPNQDKATPSLMGNVPQGVMLNKRPVFLGGQGGLVGPRRLAFGTITGAGTICRKDELRENRLIVEGSGRRINIPFTQKKIQNSKRVFLNNAIYIANLAALMQWYDYARRQFVSDDFPEALLDGLKEKLNLGISERIKRLKDYSLKLYKDSRDDFDIKWEKTEEIFYESMGYKGDTALRDTFLEKTASGIKIFGKDYIKVIKNLENNDAETGTHWLQSIVDHVSEKLQKGLKIHG